MRLGNCHSAPRITSKPLSTGPISRLILTVLIASLVLPVWGQTSHSIKIGWTYSQGADTATGFNVYRATTTGGPYTKLNSSPLPIATLSYTDTTGTGGVKYFYVVTAVDALSIESANSAEVSGIFLDRPVTPAGVSITVQ